MKGRKLNRHIPKQDAKKWKFKLFLLIIVLIGVLASIDSNLLPPVIKEQVVTQEFYKVRDHLALKLPSAWRPGSFLSVEPLAKPATPGQGYAPVERQKMEDLMDKGTAQ